MSCRAGRHPDYEGIRFAPRFPIGYARHLGRQGMTTKAELADHLAAMGNSIPCSYYGSASMLTYNGMEVFEEAILMRFGLTFDDTGKSAGVLTVGRQDVGGRDIPVFFP
jgi:hypothetical protein